MNKSLRQAEILNIIRRGAVFTQEELAEELRKQGIEATQVTLSRDLKELGVAKTNEGYRLMAAHAPRDPGLDILVQEFVVDVKQAQNLVVIRALPGSANSVAAGLDREAWPEVVGTIAGDDTVLVISPDNETAERLIVRLRVYQ
ncbi:MAG: ArgR family transcriptional regulator [Acidobacteria bacterium]|nr:ArgR family transcriptional regulator [Acidobacteriota bacterium]